MSANGDGQRADATSSSGGGDSSPPKDRAGWRRALTLPRILGGAALTALVGLLINQFVPRGLERVEDPDPLRVRAQYDVDRYGDGWSMATSETIDARSAPPRGSSCEDARRWVTESKGALVGETWLRLLLEGRRSGGITITSIRARSIDRDVPYSGSSIVCPSAGAEENVGIGFNLDSPSPVARSLDTEGNLGDPYFSQHSITLAKGETITLTTMGMARRQSHRWVIEVSFVADGDEGMTTIGEGGYRTTPAVQAYRTSWVWDWAQQPARLVPATPVRESTGQVAPETDAPSDKCTNQEIDPSDRTALSQAAGTPDPALPGSVYYGSCEAGSWAIARFEGSPGSGVFHRSNETWTFLGTIETSRCEIPSELSRMWRLPPC
jgi:hypothetical protein